MKTSKVFKEADLQAFAALSADRNPLHMDSSAARRTPEGGRVVHGMLLLLYGLDRWAGAGIKGKSLQRIQCSFKKPVLMGEKVDYVLDRKAEGPARLTALFEGLPCMEAVLTPEAPKREPGLELKGVDEKLSRLSAPLEWEKDDFLGFSAAIRNPAGPRLQQFFPRLGKILGVGNLCALVRLSYIVGMVCPGLYSLFSSLDVGVGSPKLKKGFTAFKVTAFDERFRLAEIQLGGDLNGSLKAFRRPKPFQQPSLESVRGTVTPGEFEGCRALVLGGSRGLGETTAKLICAGGGTVHLAYHQGREEAERIAAEVKASGLGDCRPVKIDILSGLTPPLKRLLGGVNCVYYYPTPPIFKKQPDLWVQGHFKEFLVFYVDRFYGMCRWIEENAPGKVQVYYPSSSALDQRPNGMTAYAMAKAAAEVLIQDMNRHFKKVRILCSRLPRLGSDQTNSILEGKREDNLSVLLPVVREIRDRLDKI